MEVSTRMWLAPLAALLPAMVVADAAPAVTIRSPLPGAVVTGEITVYAEAASDTEVSGVQFILFSPDSGSRNLGAEDTSPPYAVTWDTAAAGDGTHMLAVLARAADGRRSYAGPVTVTVANETAGDAMQ